MGYRSRVGISLAQDAFTRLEAKIQTLPQSLQEEVRSLFEDSEFTRGMKGTAPGIGKGSNGTRVIRISHF